MPHMAGSSSLSSKAASVSRFAGAAKDACRREQKARSVPVKAVGATVTTLFEQRLPSPPLSSRRIRAMETRELRGRDTASACAA